MKSVSIIIPTFNRAELLPKAIESAINQTYPCEVIVCDHGSSDNTPNVARNYGNKIKYIRKDEDKGPIVCWRDGIENATGDIIHINYDDDWIDNSFIEKTVSKFNDDVAFVYTNAMIHYSDSDITKVAFKHPRGIGKCTDIIRYLLEIKGPISPGCAIFRRTDAMKNLLASIPNASGIYGNNSGVGEDLLIFMLTALDYPNYVYIDETLAHFFAHSGSITISSGITGKDKMLFEAYSNARKYFIEANDWSSTKFENLKYFLTWNYRCGKLLKMIRKKIKNLI